MVLCQGLLSCFQWVGFRGPLTLLKFQAVFCVSVQIGIFLGKGLRAFSRFLEEFSAGWEPLLWVVGVSFLTQSRERELVIPLSVERRPHDKGLLLFVSHDFKFFLLSNRIFKGV